MCDCRHCPQLTIQLLERGMTDVPFMKGSFTEKDYVLVNHVATTFSDANGQLVRDLINQLTAAIDDGDEMEMEDDDDDIDGLDGAQGEGAVQEIDMAVDHHDDNAMIDDYAAIDGLDGDADHDISMENESMNGNDYEDDYDGMEYYDDEEYMDDIGHSNDLADSQEIVSDDDQMVSDHDIDMAGTDANQSVDIVASCGVNPNNGDNGLSADHEVACRLIAEQNELPPGRFVMLFANEMFCTLSACVNDNGEAAYGQRVNVVLGVSFGGEDDELHPFVVSLFPVHNNMNRAVDYQERLAGVINNVTDYLEDNGRTVYGFVTDDGVENRHLVINVNSDRYRCPLHDFIDMGPHYSPSDVRARMITINRAGRLPLVFDATELKEVFDAGGFNFNDPNIITNLNRFWHLKTGSQTRDNIKKLLVVGSSRCFNILHAFGHDPPNHANNHLNEGLIMYVRMIMHICEVLELMYKKITPQVLRKYAAARTFFRQVQFEDASANVNVEHVIKFIDDAHDLYEVSDRVNVTAGLLGLGYHYTTLQTIFNKNNQSIPNTQFLHDELKRELDCRGGSELGDLHFKLAPQPDELRPHTDLGLPITPLPANFGAIFHQNLLSQQPTVQEVNDLQQAEAIYAHVTSLAAQDISRFAMSDAVKDFFMRICKDE